MDIVFRTLWCLLLLIESATSYSPAKCNNRSPEILFPFQIDDVQPHELRGLPHFNLFCKQNTTMIHFPNYGDLSVKSISYSDTRLNLVDPNNCVHQVFLNLNLSFTPFTYYYKLQSYTYINCSHKLDANYFQQVPCLSASNHHVYIVRPSDSTPDSCKSVKTVEIPFAYSPYISDSSFGLSLTWASTRLEQQGTMHPNKYLRVSSIYAAMGIISCAFIVGELLYASLSKCRHEEHKEEEINELLQESKINP